MLFRVRLVGFQRPPIVLSLLSLPSKLMIIAPSAPVVMGEELVLKPTSHHLASAGRSKSSFPISFKHRIAPAADDFDIQINNKP